MHTNIYKDIDVYDRNTRITNGLIAALATIMQRSDRSHNTFIKLLEEAFLAWFQCSNCGSVIRLSAVHVLYMSHPGLCLLVVLWHSIHLCSCHKATHDNAWRKVRNRGINAIYWWLGVKFDSLTFSFTYSGALACALQHQFERILFIFLPEACFPFSLIFLFSLSTIL